MRNMHCSTQVPPMLKFLQARHWLGPGPQHPSEEHSGSQVWPSFTTHGLHHADYRLDHATPYAYEVMGVEARLGILLTEA